MDEMEKKLKLLENRIDELEKKLEDTRGTVMETLEAFYNFSGVTSNSIGSLKMAVNDTSQKVDSIYKMLKGY